MKIKVGIVGVSGYAGMVLIQLVMRHPEMELVAAMDAESVGEKPLDEIHPRLRGICDLKTFVTDTGRLSSLNPDTVFLCTPDMVSYEWVPRFLKLGIRVVDFSGAFRLKDAASYPSWYGFDHADTDLLRSAVYGLPEWNAEAIAGAKLLANPGCYPTSVILALLPLIRAGMLETGSDIYCDSKSGVTGAGRTAKQELHFAEVADSFRPYNPIAHRHAPEICQELGWNLENFTFVPHLLPVSRGIISTLYLRFQRAVRSAEIEEAYRMRYSGKPFVRILGDSRLPELRAVTHSNFCDIAWRLTGGGRRAVVFSAIDNLGKGASSQAMQNFNLMHGFEETLGLL